jgi:DNA-directed RNA polymerase specialized sigma24 family protein
VRGREKRLQGTSDWASFEGDALPHLDTLFRLARWPERDRAEAEDLVQETFVEALQAAESGGATRTIFLWSRPSRDRYGRHRRHTGGTPHARRRIEYLDYD